MLEWRKRIGFLAWEALMVAAGWTITDPSPLVKGLFWLGGVAGLLVWGFFEIKARRNHASESTDIKSNKRTQMADQCEKLALDIEEFMLKRRTGEPNHWPNDRENQEKRNEHWIAGVEYSNETSNLFRSKFDPQLAQVFYRLREMGHEPDGLLIHGSNAWVEEKIGKLRNYERSLRDGDVIRDKEYLG